MKTIKREWLESQNACKSSLLYVIENNYIGLSPAKFIHKLMTENRFSDANWLIVRCMNRKQKLAYAIFAAEQVIDIYEKKYPGNDKPRNAIEAAKKVLKYDSKKNRDTAADAAHAAAYTAYAAHAAAYAAYTAAYAAAYAVYAAYTAVYAVADASIKMETRIIENGIKILGGLICRY